MYILWKILAAGEARALFGVCVMRVFYEKKRWFKATLTILLLFALCEAALFGLVAWQAAKADSPQQADVMIVLGAGLNSDTGEPLPTLAYRLDRAVELYNAEYAPAIIVTGGMGVDEPVSEAEAMRDYLVAAGVPESAILLEDQARDTAENMALSREIMEQNGFADAIIVTSDYHMWRALRLARDAGVQATGATSPNSDTIFFKAMNLARETLAWLQYTLKVL